MPRNMSFALTTQQILDQSKTVTRRLGWNFLKRGDVIQAVEKCMGLKKGEKVKRLCLLRVTSVTREPLWRVIYERGGAAREGFPEMDEFGFVEMFCREMKCNRLARVTRIQFEYVNSVEHNGEEP